jgi:hypothetical protein
MTNASMAMPDRRVELVFAGSAEQSRVTVAFRIILAIPQIIVLYFLFIAAFFVVIIGWFGALFTGRLPEWVHTFLGGVIRWSTRVGAYLFLLTDAYPPFSFEDVDYPVRPVLPDRGPLNRVTVLFRIIVAIPALVFYQIVQNGLTFPLLIVMWFIVLFTGSMPPSLYPTYMALLRYEVRFHSWFSMLTSEYAWGMLGDMESVSTGYTPPPFVPPTGPASGPTDAPAAPPAAPPAQPFSYPSTAGEQAATPPPDAGQASPPEWPSPQPPPQPPPAPSGPPPMPPPSSWERTSGPSGDQTPRRVLILQGAARSWMIFAIVWGSIVLVGQVARNFGHHNGNHNNNMMFVDFNTAHLDSAVHLDTGFVHVMGRVPAEL